LYNRIKEFVHRDGKDKVNNYFKEKAGAHRTAARRIAITDVTFFMASP